MTSDRQRSLIERLLSETEDAVVAGRWDVVSRHVQSVLAMESAHPDALAFKALAERMGAAAPPQVSPPVEPQDRTAGVSPESDEITSLTPYSENSVEADVAIEELTTELIEKELELETLRAELGQFQKQYIRIVGVKYAELDALRAEVAAAEAALNPTDAPAQEEAARARAQAKESDQARAGFDQEAPESARFNPSNELKQLYKSTAKKVHPDFALNENDRLRRTAVMLEVNKAYHTDDEDELRRILMDWEAVGASTERAARSTTGEVTAEQKIQELRRRLLAIEAELTALRSSELSLLKTRADEAERQGSHLLADLAAAADQNIKAIRTQQAKYAE